MPTTLFVMPIKPGKKAAYLAFLKTCLEGRRDEYRDLLKRYGLNTVNIWVHSIDGKDYAIFTHDMDEDAGDRLANWPGEHPFDQWFDKHLKECYDFDGLENAPEQPTFLGKLDED